MSTPLDEAYTILNELEEDVAKVRAIWQQLEKDNPHLEQVASENRPEKCYQMWLHGATNSWESATLFCGKTDFYLNRLL